MVNLNLNNIKKSKPYYSFQIEKNNFLIKIADTYAEIKKAQQLRFKAFSAVAASGFSKNNIDKDEYDLMADHLIIVDKETKSVIGTYRILLSDKVNKHYSSREFDLSEFLKLPGRKMELGRAAVDPTARTGVIISLLWRGICEYLRVSKSEYLFGCSSMWNLKSEDIFKLCQILNYKKLVSEVPIFPLKSHWPTDFPETPNLAINEEHNEDFKLELDRQFDLNVPALVKAYINIGSKFTAPPAYDHKLNTYEFFSYVKTEHMNPIFKRKYFERPQVDCFTNTLSF